MSWRARQRRWTYLLGAYAVAAMTLAAVYLGEPAAAAFSDPHALSLAALGELALSLAACWLAFLGGCRLLLAFHIWSSCRGVQPAPGARRRAMWRLHAIAATTGFVGQARILYAVYGALGLAALAFTRDPRWLGLVAYAIGVLAWMWARFSAPPFLVFLSTSDAASVDFHRQLQKLLRPLRAMSLLNIQHGETGGPARSSLELDCLRTSNDDDWWTVITMLMEMAPLVAINADTESPGVVKEALHIVRKDIKYKTIFLTGGGDRLLRSEAELAAHIPGALIARTPILEAVVADILDKRRLPSRVSTVWHIANAARATGVWNGATTSSMGSAHVRQTPLGTMVRNPYLNIMMTCPNTGTTVETGINSSYFEEWTGHPPKDGARFRCPACSAWHSFDNTNTWLARPP